MTFKPGKSGNPKGRPKGSADKRTRLRGLLEPHAPAIVEKCIQMALDGDSNAMRLCIERLIPRAKDEPLVMDAAKDISGKDALKFIGDELLVKVMSGELTAEEAKCVLDVLKGYRENILVEELQARLEFIEKTIKANGRSILNPNSKVLPCGREKIDF